jgi:alpha-L-arabinofuranosidase
VKHWQIGNEQSGEEYERRLVDYARAIRARHPDLILMASYPSDTILADLSTEVDYVCPHIYDPCSPQVERELRGLIERIQRVARNQALRIGVTEWNHTGGHWGWARSWLLTHYNALNAARMFNLYQRAGDAVRVANRSNLVNSCCSGSIQTRPGRLHVTPAYHVQKAYATLSGDGALRVALEPGEALDVSATRRSADGGTVVAVVNSGPRPEARAIRLPAGGAEALRVWTLAAPLDAVNSFEDPERVAPAESTLQAPGRRFEHVFPPWSVTLLRD